MDNNRYQSINLTLQIDIQSTKKNFVTVNVVNFKLFLLTVFILHQLLSICFPKLVISASQPAKVMKNPKYPVPTPARRLTQFFFSSKKQ